MSGRLRNKQRLTGRAYVEAQQAKGREKVEKALSHRDDAQRRRDLAIIHIAKKSCLEAGTLDEAAYRAIIDGLLSKYDLPRTRDEASSADLDERGRGDLIEIFRIDFQWDERAETRRKGRTGVRYVGKGAEGEAGHLTQAQAGYIAQLEDELGWTDDPKRLVGFIERQIGVNKTPSMLRNREASDVITGLERMAGRKPHPRSRKES